jgi:periplasmic protein TonB
MLARLGIGVALGVVVTTALFFLMQALIATERSPFTERPEARALDFVRLQEDTRVEVRERKPPPPPPVDEPPPDMPPPDFDASAPSIGVDIGAVGIDRDVRIGGIGGFEADGEYLPIVQVAPDYPRTALERGIEGYVLLEFTVTETGSVEDPVVVEADPPRIFDTAARNAALRFKYRPRVIDGEPVRVHGVQFRMVFELAQEGGRRR